MRKTLTITVLALLVGSSVHAQPRSGRPVVMMDMSHEWLFGYMTLKDEVLVPNGVDVVWRDCSLSAGPALTEGDMLFVGQVGTSSVPFSPSERELLLKYVSDGGSLFLSGEARQPIVEVARCFGLDFVEQRVATPFVTGPDLRRLGAPDSVPAADLEVPYAITAPPNARGLLFGQGGEPLAVELPWGRGRVVCVSARGWDMQAGDEVQRRAVQSGMLALFRVCLGQKQPLPGAGSTVQIKAENLVTLPELPGWLIYYPITVEPEAKAIIALMPQMARAVQSYSGTATDTLQFHFEFVACDCGGLTTSNRVCVQARGKPGDNLAVAAHEYTHTLTGGLPHILGEGWASEVANRVRRELGYPRDPRPEDELRLQSYREVDPTGTAVGVALEPSESQDGLYARKVKLMWMVGELEKRYGADFMVRFLDLRRALYGPGGPTISQALDCFSVVAGEDLGPWYRQLGVHPAPLTRLSQAEMDRLVAADRDVVAVHREDARRLQEYRANPAPFHDDRWRDAWSIEASLYGKDKFWVDDLGRPDEPLAYLSRSDIGDRRGFGIFHALAPDKVGRIVSTAVVPEQGQTTLYLGFARRDGGPTELRLKADGKTIWERTLDRDGWWHVPVSLAEFAGRRVRLELEDDTKGQWGCREVFIDYLTLRTEP